MKKTTLVITLLLCLYAALNTFFSYNNPAVAGDPIVAIGHGAVIGANGKEVKLTPKFIETVQQFYLNKLLTSIDQKRTINYLSKEQIGATQKTISNEVSDKILATALLIDWLIEKAQPKEGIAQMTSVNNALRWQYVLKMQPKSEQPKDNRWSKGLKPEIAKLLEGKLGVSINALTNEGGTEYCKQCLEAGVPIPKSMFGPEWKLVGEIENEFLSAGLKAELWIYESKSPMGICIALPRFPAGGDKAELFGVICLGTQTSKVCFFDNPSGRQFTRNVQIDFKEFVGGFDLVANGQGVCSDCHAGENPYVVHPDKPAFASIINKIQSPAWHSPMVAASWPQNPGPSNALDAVASPSKCNSCHVNGGAGRFPQVSTQLGGYCSVVLGRATAVGGTMPRFGADRTPYLNHINALMASCGSAPNPGGVSVPANYQDEPSFISPPIVIDPLYQCATRVAVQSVLLDAKVILSVNGVEVGSVSPARNPSFIEFSGLTPLKVGDKVTAIQIKNGVSSSESAIVRVRDYKVDYPAGLPKPTIDPTLIYECAEIVAVRHVPCATVKVFKNGINVAGRETSTGWSGFFVGAIAKDDKFTAEISLCSNSSPLSDIVMAVAAPSALSVARLDPATVFSGQELVNIGNLTNGSKTSVSEATFGGLGSFSRPESWLNNFDVKTPLGRALNAGERLIVAQQLCKLKNKIETPPVAECETLPPPRILHPIVGANYVVVSEAIPGAIIRVYDGSGAEIGDGSGTVIVLKRPITGADTLTVVQQVGKCISRMGYRVSVRNQQ